jgi:hypothetical protein
MYRPRIARSSRSPNSGECDAPAGGRPTRIGHAICVIKLGKISGSRIFRAYIPRCYDADDLRPRRCRYVIGLEYMPVAIDARHPRKRIALVSCDAAGCKRAGVLEPQD